jgi:hypothetical protein
MQEGARDLSLAFMIGRAEEALWRLSKGQPVDEKDRSHFTRLWHLFADASEAYSWAATRAAVPPPPTALRALQAITPIMRSRSSELRPEELLTSLTTTARSLARGQPAQGNQLDGFSAVLRELASLAGGQGREALGSYAPPSAPTLTKRFR